MALPSDLPYQEIRVVFTDLDGTLYPGDTHEDEPKASKPALQRNMSAVAQLENLGVPVLPATGNNVSFAQAKLLHPETHQKLRDLSTTPGIYCNGALVLGAGGKEVLCKNLSGFVERFVAHWAERSAPMFGEICIVGLVKDKTLLLEMGTAGEKKVGNAFLEQMMVKDSEMAWLDRNGFVAEQERILSLLVMFPNPTEDSALIEFQSWLQSCGLLQFGEVKQKSSGEATDVCCKHVHVPGIGPE